MRSERAGAGFTLIELLVVVFIIGLLAAFSDVGAGLFSYVFYLVFGWWNFATANIEKMQFNPVLAGEAAICVAVLAAGSHWFCAWLYREAYAGAAGAWRFRWTATGLGLLFLLFAAGIGIIGLTHQAAWLYSYDGPRTVSTWGEPAVVAEAIEAGKAITARVAEQHQRTGAFPGEEVRYPGPPSADRPVDAIVQHQGGVVVVHLKPTATSAGETITFTPRSEGGKIRWTCTSTLPKRNLPFYCRA